MYNVNIVKIRGKKGCSIKYNPATKIRKLSIATRKDPSWHLKFEGLLGVVELQVFLLSSLG